MNKASIKFPSELLSSNGNRKAEGWCRSWREVAPQQQSPNSISCGQPPLLTAATLSRTSSPCGCVSDPARASMTSWRGWSFGDHGDCLGHLSTNVGQGVALSSHQGRLHFHRAPVTEYYSQPRVLGQHDELYRQPVGAPHLVFKGLLTDPQVG